MLAIFKENLTCSFSYYLHPVMRSGSFFDEEKSAVEQHQVSSLIDYQSVRHQENILKDTLARSPCRA